MQKAKTFKLSQRKNVLRKSLEENFEKFPKQAKIAFIRKNEPTNKNDFSLVRCVLEKKHEELALNSRK